jgi:DNA-binding CsgD family transcriptional regulator/PAS domain-containing protein
METASAETRLLRLYDAVICPDLWPQILQELASEANAVGCCIVIDDDKQTLIAPPMSPELVEPLADFIESGWHRHDLRGRRGWPLYMAGRRVVIEHDVSTEEERRTGAYHNEWLRPWDLPWWAAVGFPAGNSQYALALLRNTKQGPFTPAEADILATWRPHLTRAVSLARLVSQGRADSVLEVLQLLDRAAFILDATGRVEQFNPSAEAMLKREFKLRQGKLRTRDRKDDVALQRLLAAVLTPHFPSGSDSEGPILASGLQGRRLLIEALPIVGLLSDVFANTRALLIVTELDARPVAQEERLRQIFRLSGAQAAVAARLAAGSELSDIADSLKIARGTARNHLKAVFQKTGARRQSELTSLIQRIRPGLNDRFWEVGNIA